MKILYLGCYRDSTGWARAAIDYILALDKAGADVTCRPMKLNKATPIIPERVQELENRPHKGLYDVVVQHTPPSYFDYYGGIPLNIGMYATETDRFDHSDWPQRINTLDRAWVFNHQSLCASMRSGIKIPATVIPHACDVSRYERAYKPLPIRERLGDNFVFYFIGEFNRRKNITALLKAFHLEFDVNEPVSLVIKVNGSDDPIEQVKIQNELNEHIGIIKDGMKLYGKRDNYKREIALVGNYTDEEIMRLHASCDCFVCPSYGEAWCIPAFDAMSLGRTPIVSNYAGFRQYLSPETGWLVDGHLEPVFGLHRETSFLPDLFTSREKWFQVDIDSLRQAMREAYENRQLREIKAKAGTQRAYDFSHEKVGKMMLEDLNG